MDSLLRFGAYSIIFSRRAPIELATFGLFGPRSLATTTTIDFCWVKSTLVPLTLSLVRPPPSLVGTSELANIASTRS